MFQSTLGIRITAAESKSSPVFFLSFFAKVQIENEVQVIKIDDQPAVIEDLGVKVFGKWGAVFLGEEKKLPVTVLSLVGNFVGLPFVGFGLGADGGAIPVLEIGAVKEGESMVGEVLEVQVGLGFVPAKP